MNLKTICKYDLSDFKSIIPKCQRKWFMKKHGANDIIENMYHSFSFGILRGCLRTWESKIHTISYARLFERVVIKFASMITLKGFNRAFKLNFNISMEIKKCLVSSRYVGKGSNPYIVSKIINKNEIIFVAWTTTNRRGT